MIRPLRIAQVSPLYERVPPALYGGTERIVSYLTEELVRRGHQVTLFASGDSSTRATLVAPAPHALRLDSTVNDELASHIMEMAQVFERARDFDVIHAHVGYLAFPFARFTRGASLHTLHGRLDLPSIYPVFRHFRDEPLVSISHAQRLPLKGLGVTWAATVHHGLPLAKRVGLPLKIAAKVDPVDRAYFEREIQPLLGHPLIEFVGEIGEEAKASFLGAALALVFPIDWPEPFGLVMIEALACGTPVIARRCGSVPEIIVSGRTGFIADTLEGMELGVRRLDRIDRAKCRREVEARFTVERMVDGYETIYRGLAAQAAASA